jgi:hypothetical protein
MAGRNYAAGVPMGNNQGYMVNSPAPIKAVEQYYSDNGSASSVITLTDNTTAVEISASGAPVVIRWVYATDGTGANSSVIATPIASANFDHVVASGTVRRFVVPIEVQNNAEGSGSVVGQRVANGLFARLAYKSQGVASVYVTEYGSSNSY